MKLSDMFRKASTKVEKHLERLRTQSSSRPCHQMPLKWLDMPERRRPGASQS